MGLFDGTCVIPAGSTSYNQKGSAYATMKWISVGCTIVTAAILTTLKILHLRTYTRPKEQRQIVRILIAPTVWSVVSLVQILDYRNAQYYQPLGEVYESIYLCCVFLLFIQYAAPGAKFDGDMFSTVHAADESDSKLDFDWPRLTWIFVFQFPVVNAISAVITEGTELAGTYCNGNFNPKFGYLWATIIQSLTLGAAVTSVLRFYKRMKRRIKARRGLAKLIGFKATVSLMWIQQIIFGILIDQEVLKPSATFSYVDLLYGLPNVVACVEMVFFAIWFCWVCSPHEYSVARQGVAPLPLWKAIPDSFNPKDWILGIGRMFTVCLHMHRSGGFKQWQSVRKEVKAQKKAAGGSKFSLFPSRPRAVSSKIQGQRISEEALEYRGSYTPLGDSLPLVDYSQKPHDSLRY